MQMREYMRSRTRAESEDRAAMQAAANAGKAIISRISGDPELDANGAAAFRAAIVAARDAVTEDNTRLVIRVLYPDWTAGAHAAGEIYNAGDQTWECYAAYDNAEYPGIRPGNAAWGTFNRPLHGTSMETARPFAQPTGAHDMYKAGEYMIWTDGKTYCCTADTAYSPADYAAAWEAVA